MPYKITENGLGRIWEYTSGGIDFQENFMHETKETFMPYFRIIYADPGGRDDTAGIKNKPLTDPIFIYKNASDYNAELTSKGYTNSPARYAANVGSIFYHTNPGAVNGAIVGYYRDEINNEISDISGTKYSLYGRYMTFYNYNESVNFRFPAVLMYTYNANISDPPNGPIVYGVAQLQNGGPINVSGNRYCIYYIYIHLYLNEMTVYDPVVPKTCRQNYNQVLYYGDYIKDSMDLSTNISVKTGGSFKKITDPNAFNVKTSNSFKPVKKVMVKSGNIWKTVLNNDTETVPKN